MAPLEVYVQTLFVLLQTYLTFDRLARLGLQGVSACSRKARQRARRRVNTFQITLDVLIYEIGWATVRRGT